jgi:hypothetical protein
MLESRNPWIIWVFGRVWQLASAFRERLPGVANVESTALDSGVKPADLAMADPPRRCYGAPMAVFLSTFILPVAVGAVALVLLLGLVNMMRGGSPNRSQQLMRLRVLLQFVAIVVIMVTIWAMGR